MCHIEFVENQATCRQCRISSEWYLRLDADYLYVEKIVMRISSRLWQRFDSVLSRSGPTSFPGNLTQVLKAEPRLWCRN